jgi:hypothetical protein
MEYGKFPGLYSSLCKPRGDEYAEYLRRNGKFYEIGESSVREASIQNWNHNSLNYG